MLKRKILSVLLAISIIWFVTPSFSIAEVTSAETSTSVIMPYPDLPSGVQFEMKTDENGRAILATIYCANSSTMNLGIKVVGGVVYAETSPIYGSQGANAVAESKLIEGKYDLPAHSRVVIAHVSLSIRPIITSPTSIRPIVTSPAVNVSDTTVYPFPILPFTDWVVRAKLDVVPVVYPEPLLMTATDENGEPQATETELSTMAPVDEVHCMSYPYCFEHPVTVIVEDTIQMDYRWNRLDAIMSEIKKVNSNVALTQGIVTTQLKVATASLSASSSKPAATMLSRPSR